MVLALYLLFSVIDHWKEENCTFGE